MLVFIIFSLRLVLVVPLDADVKVVRIHLAGKMVRT